jgi:hypothetical protein
MAQRRNGRLIFSFLEIDYPKVGVHFGDARFKFPELFECRLGLGVVCLCKGTLSLLGVFLNQVLGHPVHLGGETPD